MENKKNPKLVIGEVVKLNHCEITELIFRKDGTFTIVFTDLTVKGIYSRLSQSQTSSLVLTSQLRETTMVK